MNLFQRYGPQIYNEQTMEKIIIHYRNRLIQQRYSKNTINIYFKYFYDFYNHFHGQYLSGITREQINEYILNLIKSEAISSSQQNQRINAIKFYYEKILGKEKQYYDIYRPGKEKRQNNITVEKYVNTITGILQRVQTT